VERTNWTTLDMRAEGKWSDTEEEGWGEIRRGLSSQVKDAPGEITKEEEEEDQEEVRERLREEGKAAAAAAAVSQKTKQAKGLTAKERRWPEEEEDAGQTEARAQIERSF
jgi:hypothetical protein